MILVLFFSVVDRQSKFNVHYDSIKFLSEITKNIVIQD